MIIKMLKSIKFKPIYFGISLLFLLFSFSIINYYFNSKKDTNRSYLIETELDKVDSVRTTILSITFKKASGGLYSGSLDKLIEDIVIAVFEDAALAIDLKEKFFADTDFNNDQYVSFIYTDLKYALRTYTQCENKIICKSFDKFLFDEYTIEISNRLKNTIEKMNEIAINERKITLKNIHDRINVEVQKLEALDEFIDSLEGELPINKIKELIDKGGISSIYLLYDKVISLTTDGKYYYSYNPNYAIMSEWFMGKNIYLQYQADKKLYEKFNIPRDLVSYSKLNEIKYSAIDVNNSIDLLNIYKDQFFEEVSGHNLIKIISKYETAVSSEKRVIFIFVISLLLSLILYGALISYNPYKK